MIDMLHNRDSGIQCPSKIHSQCQCPSTKNSKVPPTPPLLLKKLFLGLDFYSLGHRFTIVFALTFFHVYNSLISMLLKCPDQWSYSLSLYHFPLYLSLSSFDILTSIICTQGFATSISSMPLLDHSIAIDE